MQGGGEIPTAVYQSAMRRGLTRMTAISMWPAEGNREQCRPHHGLDRVRPDEKVFTVSGMKVDKAGVH